MPGLGLSFNKQLLLHLVLLGGCYRGIHGPSIIWSDHPPQQVWRRSASALHFSSSSSPWKNHFILLVQNLSGLLLADVLVGVFASSGSSSSCLECWQRWGLVPSLAWSLLGRHLSLVEAGGLHFEWTHQPPQENWMLASDFTPLYSDVGLLQTTCDSLQQYGRSLLQLLTHYPQ